MHIHVHISMAQTLVLISFLVEVSRSRLLGQTTAAGLQPLGLSRLWDVTSKYRAKSCLLRVRNLRSLNRVATGH